MAGWVVRLGEWNDQGAVWKKTKTESEAHVLLMKYIDDHERKNWAEEIKGGWVNLFTSKFIHVERASVEVSTRRQELDHSLEGKRSLPRGRRKGKTPVIEEVEDDEDTPPEGPAVVVDASVRRRRRKEAAEALSHFEEAEKPSQFKRREASKEAVRFIGEAEVHQKRSDPKKTTTSPSPRGEGEKEGKKKKKKKSSTKEKKAKRRKPCD